MTRAGLIARNLTRKRLRLILTLVAITIAFLLFAMLQAVNAVFNAGVDLAAADRLVVTNKINFTQPLPLAYYNRIQGVDGVEAATHQSWFGGYYQDPRNFMVVFAVDLRSFLDVYSEYEVVEGSPEKLLRNRRGLLVGKDVADRFGFSVGDQIPLSSNIFNNKDGTNTWQFVVEGIFKPEDPTEPSGTTLFHYEYFNEARTNGRDFIGNVILLTGDSDRNQAVVDRIDNLFANSPYETETSTEAAFSQAFIDQLGNIGLIITSVVAAAFFTILLIVGNTMALAVRERTGELAVMKTLGFESGGLFAMVLAESLLLAVIGGILGVLGAEGIIAVVANAPVPQFLKNMTVDRTIWLQAFGLMAGLGFLTGIIPAWQALRVNIATAFSRA